MISFVVLVEKNIFSVCKSRLEYVHTVHKEFVGNLESQINLCHFNECNNNLCLVNNVNTHSIKIKIEICLFTE